MIRTTAIACVSVISILFAFIFQADVFGYCSATSTSYDSQNEYIYRVIVGSIDSLPTGNDHYSDYTYLSTTMEAGNTYSFSVIGAVNGQSYTGYPSDIFAIWIDWNIDGDFSDSGEECYYVDDYGYFSGNITVPANISSGTTRMRVRLIDGYYNSMYSCGNSYYGEVEDYTINLVGASTGGTIKGVKFNDLDGDGFFDAGERNMPGWHIYIDMDNDGIFTSNEPNMVTIDPNGSYEITGLDPGTYTVAEIQQDGWGQTYPSGSGTHSVTITGEQVVDNINFGNAVLPETITLSGHVQFNPIYGLKDVVVTTSTGESTTTDIYGYYEFTVSAPWTGTITPSKTNWTFSPQIKSYYNLLNNQNSMDFTPIEPALKYYGGSGTEYDPYRIRYPEELQELGSNPSDWDKHFELVANISLSDYTGEQFNMIGFHSWTGISIPFTGTFNGNGYSISNFNYQYVSDKQEAIGIFSYVYGPNAEIKDTTVARPNVDGGDHAAWTGTLVGWLRNGVVTNCSAERGSVSAKTFDCGGLVGEVSAGCTLTQCSSTNVDVAGGAKAGGLVSSNSGTISHCQSDCSVEGQYDIGGLVGDNSADGLIEYCSSSGSATGDQQIGGLVGTNSAVITKSYSTSVINTTGTYQNELGGFVGRNINGQIDNCYANGKVNGGKNCGGLVGVNWSTSEPTTITNCYSASTVSGAYPLGGLVGQNVSGLITNSFWDVDVCSYNNGVGTPFGSTAMQNISTYISAGWDFVEESANGTDDVWKMYHPGTYPKLSWQKYSGKGTLADPYYIYCAQEMNAIGLDEDDWDKCFKLMQDIDMSQFTGSAYNLIGVPPSPGTVSKSFEGIFEGNEHTISNFSYSGSESYPGLFRCVGGFGGTVKNVTLTGVNINSSSSAGALVGRLNGGVIANCHSEGTVNGDTAGGLIGYFRWGCVYDCSSSGTVSGDGGVGGLVGDTFFAEIYNSYSTASVSGNTNVGGFIGESDICNITNCYSTGVVTGTNDVGGFVGYNYGDAVYSGCVWNQTVNPLLAGIGYGSNVNVVGRTTAQMQSKSTFAGLGWGFVDDMSEGIKADWIMPQGGGYPVLWWQATSLGSLPPGLFAGGDGSVNNPYLISNAPQFNSIGHNPLLMDKHFKLTSDIDLTGNNLNMIGGNSCEYAGAFDGNGHKISNLNTTGLFQQNMGVFQKIGASGLVRDLEVSDPNFGGIMMTKNFIGGICYENNGTIKNCSVTGGSVKASNFAGGIACYNSGTISNCYSSANVSAEYISGGLVVKNQYGGLIIKSVMTGMVTSDFSPIGGIAAFNDNSIISYCHADGKLNCSRTGGIVGENSGLVSDCFSNSKIESTSYTGGIVGINYGVFKDAIVQRCYSTSLISSTSTKAGGVVGANLLGTVTDSFFDSGITPGIEGVYTPPDPNNAVAMTTSQMQTSGTFINAGWDFLGESANGDEDIWLINEGNGYPKFLWERVNVTGWYDVDMADLSVVSANWKRSCQLDINRYDIVDDSIIDLKDFAVLMENWGMTDCGVCGKADLTGDGNVAVDDLQVLVSVWLESYDCSRADIDFSGQVGISDLSLLAENWIDGI